MGSSKEDSMNSKTLVILFGILLLDLLAFTCILPLFPSILEFYANNSGKDSLYGSLNSVLSDFQQKLGIPDVKRFNFVLFGGVLGSTFSLAQYLSAPVAGAFSDVYGRKRVLLLSLIGTFASYFLWAQSRSFPIFLLSRVVGGFSKIIVSLSTAIVSDVCGTEKRGKGMAMIGLAFSVGFLIGPSIGAYFSYRARKSPVDFYVMPACFACTLTVMEAVLVFLTLPETLTKRANRNDAFKKALGYINPVSIFLYSRQTKDLSAQDLRSVRRISLAYFLYLFLYSGVEFTLTFLTHLRFGYTSVEQAKMFFYIGLIMIAVQGGCVRRIPTASQKKAVMSGLAVIMPSFALLAFSHSTWLFYSGLFLYSVASATIVPCITTMVSLHAPETHKGALLGTFRSIGLLARALGPVIICLWFWLFGPETCYLIGAISMLGPLYIVYSL